MSAPKTTTACSATTTNRYRRRPSQILERRSVYSAAAVSETRDLADRVLATAGAKVRPSRKRNVRYAMGIRLNGPLPARRGAHPCIARSGPRQEPDAVTWSGLDSTWRLLGSIIDFVSAVLSRGTAIADPDLRIGKRGRFYELNVYGAMGLAGGTLAHRNLPSISWIGGFALSCNAPNWGTGSSVFWPT